MKSLAQLAVCALLFSWFASPAPAAFTSLYVFGDGASTTTNSPGGTIYHGKRYCNGRVWVEVLAQWQGITYESNKNWSYWGHYSPNLVTNVNNFIAPPDANTSLFLVWINNADFVGYLYNDSFKPYTTNNLAIWTNAINQSLTNHWRAITNLYAKGARTLIMPTAVDITKTPNYPGLNPSEKNFIRQRILDFNLAFVAMLQNATNALPGFKVHVPDLFSLLDSAVATPTLYGLTNSTSDALDMGYTALNGFGTNFLFWDYIHPTAKFQMVIAEISQQLLAPTRINQIVSFPGSNRLDAANIPIGRNGVVMGCTNLVNWVNDQNFTSTNLNQSIFVPAAAPMRFYRLRFPFVWTWP